MALTDSWHDMVHDMRDEMHDLATITHVEPARQAFLMLWGLFVVAPILFGIDKFAEVLTGDWAGYLATWVDDLLPGSASDAMHLIGVVEIAAGLLVLAMPRIGGYVVALWLAGIVVNLVSTGEYYDIALRDVGLMVAAIALARLATTFHHREDAAA
jgi:hypothetical protein